MTSLRDQIRNLNNKTAPDYDPEDDFAQQPTDESDDDRENLKLSGGREHYESVGKSKLRKPDQPSIGKKYEGVAVSWNDINDELDHDPFAPVDEGSEEDPFAPRNDDYGSDSGSSEGEQTDGGSVGHLNHTIRRNKHAGKDNKERDNRRPQLDLPKKANGSAKTDDRNQQAEDMDSMSEDDSEHEANLSMDSEEESDENESDSSLASSPSSTPPQKSKSGPLTDRDKIKALAINDAATFASSLSAAANTDVRKGRAVKAQRQTFDRLIDARIKLQKGLTVLNDLNLSFSDEEAQNTARSAEEAALALWSTINSIRQTINSTQGFHPDKKRKAPPTDKMPSTSLWNETEALEIQAQPHRRKILDKWSSKTRSSTLTHSLSLSSSQQADLSQVLDTYLTLESEKLIASSSSSTIIYDDSQFYQSLLRDLIATRASTSASSTATATIPHPSSLKSTKKKNIVDTKASKGRKVRYTVHEKLLNFMAPEDRNTWTERGRREFFMSLFGGVQEVLREDGVNDEGDERGFDDMDGVDAEGEGELRLFG